MYLLLIGLIVLAALLMCFVVLIQNSKGGGLASSFASSNQIMGVRKTTDFIEKLTWGLAAFMVACSVLTAYFVPIQCWIGCDDFLQSLVFFFRELALWMFPFSHIFAFIIIIINKKLLTNVVPHSLNQFLTNYTITKNKVRKKEGKK